MTRETADAAGALLMELTRRGIELETHADRLRYRPRSAMTPDLIGRVRASKTALMAILGATLPVGEPEASGCSERQPEAARWPTNAADAPEAVATLATARSGWTPDAWAARLRQLADACEALHPARAGELRAAAGLIEREDTDEDLTAYLS